MRYTLDRIENNLYIFVEKGNEINELIIPADEVIIKFEVGEIVNVISGENGYSFEQLEEETKTRKEDVQNLINKLKNK